MDDRTNGSGPDLERELIRVMLERRITRRQLLERLSLAGTAVILAPIAAACSSGATPTTAASAAATAAASAAAGTPAASASAEAVATASAPPTPQPSPEGDLYIYNWDQYIGDTTVAGLREAVPRDQGQVRQVPGRGDPDHEDPQRRQGRRV